MPRREEPSRRFHVAPFEEIDDLSMSGNFEVDDILSRHAEAAYGPTIKYWFTDEFIGMVFIDRINLATANGLPRSEIP